MTKPIEILETRFGYFPQRFVANGQEFHVTAVNRCWTEKSKLVFLVACGDDKFRLSQNLKSKQWSMEIPQ